MMGINNSNIPLSVVLKFIMTICLGFNLVDLLIQILPAILKYLYEVNKVIILNVLQMKSFFCYQIITDFIYTNRSVAFVACDDNRHEPETPEN